MVTFVDGNNKRITIGKPGISGMNVLEMIFREEGRFVIRSSSGFIALSQSKSRNITISGTLGAGALEGFFHVYEDNPFVLEFEQPDMFPQDLTNEYAVDELMLYGVMWEVNMALTGEPADVDPPVVLMAVDFNAWISRQPMSSWSTGDAINVLALAYETQSMHNMSGAGTSGVAVNTVKKHIVPMFSPIKTYLYVRKQHDKMRIYTDAAVVGYHGETTNGGSIEGSASITARLIMGRGYLPEEVEELLSAHQ